jgi:hypothetical protein
MTSIDNEFDGLVSAALDIATRDAALRRELKDSILRDNLTQVLECACALVGVDPTGSILAMMRRDMAA